MEEITLTDQEKSEILSLLDKLNRKVDKLTNIVTKMGKAMHLIPVTEKEEREIQLLQRSNMAQTAKIANELAEMAPKDDNPTPEMLTIFDNYSREELFGDVLGDEYLGGNG